jgi:hypothetical protein
MQGTYQLVAGPLLFIDLDAGRVHDGWDDIF